MEVTNLKTLECFLLLYTITCTIQQSSCYTEDGCKPAIINSRQKQLSQIIFIR